MSQSYLKNNSLLTKVLLLAFATLSVSCASMTSEQFNKSVRKTVTENLKDVRACAENQTPKPQGKMIVSWSIDTGGKVTKVSEVKNETKQPALYTCVSEKIKSWKFPEPRKNIIATVQYPFVFNMND